MLSKGDVVRIRKDAPGQGWNEDMKYLRGTIKVILKIHPTYSNQYAIDKGLGDHGYWCIREQDCELIASGVDKETTELLLEL